MELRHSKDWAILNDKLICVTKREVSMQRGEIMWKKHWQNEDGGWEKVRGMAALEFWVGGGQKGDGGAKHGVWQALDRGRREGKHTRSPNLV